MPIYSLTTDYDQVLDFTQVDLASNSDSIFEYLHNRKSEVPIHKEDFQVQCNIISSKEKN